MRKRLNQEATKILMEYFEKTPKPTARQKVALAKKVGITPHSLQIWFQNKRVKLRKDLCELKYFAHNKSTIFPGVNNLFIPKVNLKSRKNFADNDIFSLLSLHNKKLFKFRDYTFDSIFDGEFSTYESPSFDQKKNSKEIKANDILNIKFTQSNEK